ncbi:hypothetical protein CRUP_015036 [Coryphaenoides rupestris]|nr:hypothetical protein CRUP_015036 [Coryphaenoides rupestris]
MYNRTTGFLSRKHPDPPPRLMQHIEQHAEVQRGNPGSETASCSFCYRRFSSPFSLQCHLEAVHSNHPSTAVCYICEWCFVEEELLLEHMKRSHRPGEMPYACQAAHANTSSMLCLYCLRVHRYGGPYQEHHSRHQRRRVFSCDRCRLYFLSGKELSEHKKLNHRTHRRPRQIQHLPPGTKVTVRTYAVVRGRDALKNGSVPAKVIDMAPKPPPQEPPREKPLVRPSALASQLKTQR